MSEPQNFQGVQADLESGEEAIAWARSFGRDSDIAREARAKARRRERRRRASLAAMSCLALVACALFFARPNAPQTPASTATVSAPLRQELPDGSLVELRSGARIDVRFTSASDIRRVVLTAGEAHFAVAKDLHRPFVVEASGVDVTAVGTAFSVAVDPDRVAVVVTEGKVQVERPAAPAPLTVLEAGHAVVVDLAPQSDPLRTVALPAEQIAERLSWRVPRIRFSNTPLGEAVEVFNRYSSVQLELADNLRELRVGGSIRADNTAPFLLLLNGEFGIDAVALDNPARLRLVRP